MADERPYSVTQAMTLAKGALEGVRVRVIGEVSELSDKPGYKAAYFTLCDQGARMPCLMWKDSYAASGVVLRSGMLVEVSGQFGAYLPKGTMQFTVRTLAPAGEGTLRLQVAELAKRLQAEGLFAAERKRPLPRFPERIGVVTSPRGKAVHDVLRTLKRRYPLGEVVLAGIAVEGVDAHLEITRGLEAVMQGNPDVVLLVRGGGSYEDLMPFNHELVARAVASCAVPVISGVGHEPDTSIVDMVADQRASTPTAAAEACAPSIAEVGAMLARERRGLVAGLSRRVERAGHAVDRLAGRPLFCDSHVLLGSREQGLDLLGSRLRAALPGRLDRIDTTLGVLRDRMRRVGESLLAAPAARVSVATASLHTLSPLAILSRGYAVAYAPDGSIVSDPSALSPGDRLSVRVARGSISATVTHTTVQKEES